MLTNRTTLAQLREMDTGRIAQLPTDHLALLAEDVSELKADARRVSDKLAAALDMRFGAAATAARRGEGKDTGRVRLCVEGIEITADLPKKVDWDQAKLSEAVSVLRSWGEDPADYVTTEMSVPESRYAAWPPRIHTLFEPARTVAAGRPTYTIRSINR